MGEGHRSDASRLEQVQATVASLELFATCGRHEHELIGRLATLAHVAGGVVLCAEGEAGQTFYAIAHGEVAVFADGCELARLGPGCGFGEVALLGGEGRRIATVTTTMPSELVLFSRPEFATLMAEVPQVAHSLLAESRRRLAAGGGTRGPFATS
jgi:CRP-like cAMP-binding protein